MCLKDTRIDAALHQPQLVAGFNVGAEKVRTIVAAEKLMKDL
jgi:hypothetical protein